MIKKFLIKEGLLIMSCMVGCSYWVCLFSAITCLMLYTAGFKTGKYVTLSLIIYTLIESVKICF